MPSYAKGTSSPCVRQVMPHHGGVACHIRVQIEETRRRINYAQTCKLQTNLLDALLFFFCFLGRPFDVSMLTHYFVLDSMLTNSLPLCSVEIDLSCYNEGQRHSSRRIHAECSFVGIISKLTNLADYSFYNGQFDATVTFYILQILKPHVIVWCFIIWVIHIYI